MLHIDVKKQLGTLSLEAHLDIPWFIRFGEVFPH